MKVSITITAPSLMEAYQCVLIAASQLLMGKKQLHKQYATSSIALEVTEDEPAPV